VKTYVSPKLGAYAGLVCVGLLAALLLGRPEPVALVAPFIVGCAVAVALNHTSRIQITARLDRARALEGEVVFFEVDILARTPTAWLQVHVPVPAGLTARVPARATARGVRLAAGARRRLRIPVRCTRWGAYRLGVFWTRSHDVLGFFITEARFECDQALRVYPRPETARALIVPHETQVFAGNRLSRRTGEGIEFADVRTFAPGDQVRHINWRLTSRQGTLYVNQQHPERNADIVLFLDSFSDVSGPAGGTLEQSVRVAATLAERYLRQRDRIGLIGFGGSLRWLLPSTGIRQVYRIVDALLDTTLFLSYVWKDLDIIPPRTLPPKALVIAISPLLDPRTVQALFDLRGRGFDLAILDISPVPFVGAGREETDRLAFRLWKLHREALHVRFRRIGVPVAVCTPDRPLAIALEEVSTFRRSVRTARV
jgi:uncharacterized protein (DUF58 family)